MATTPSSWASADKWHQAFMENEVCLVAALSFDLKTTSELAERAGLLDGPLTVALREINLTTAHKVQTILAKLEDCGTDGYARFLSVLDDESVFPSPEQSQLYAEVAQRINSSIQRISSHDTTAGENVVPRGVRILRSTEDVLAGASMSASCCPRMVPPEPDDSDDTDKHCVGSIIRFEESYAKTNKGDHPQDVVFGPGLVKPKGVLLRKSYRRLYTTLFRTAWDGQDAKANEMVNDILRRNIATDLKVISLEVIHTVDWKSDLQKLEMALAMSQSGTCENPGILTCRILRRLAGLHYRAKNLQIASNYNQQALNLAEGIMPDIDTIYTFRLQALLLFEEFKETKEESMRRGADKYFCKAMDHLKHVEREQWKKGITERVKISKAMFHLDTANCIGKNDVDACMEICARAEDVLEDVDCNYLTEGDQGFYHNVQAKLLAGTPHRQADALSQAEWHAQTAESIYRHCGFHERRKEVNDFLTSLKTGTLLDH